MSTPGNIITWTQTTAWSDIVSQITPGQGTIVLLVDDGTEDYFSLNAASGDLSNVLFQGFNVGNQPGLAIDAGFSTTGAYLNFQNIDLLSRGAPLVGNATTVLFVQANTCLFEADGNVMFDLDATGELGIALTGAYCGLQTVNTTPIVQLADGASVGITMDGGSVSNASTPPTPVFVLAAGASSATVTFDASNESRIDPAAFGPGVSPNGFHAEYGKVDFTSTGPLFVDVPFAIPYLDDNDWSMVGMVVYMTTDGDTIPVVGIVNPTKAGFRLRTNTAFNGSVYWTTQTQI